MLAFSCLKQEREFFDTAELDWVPAAGAAGVMEKVLSQGDGAILTRPARWEPGLDTTPAGVIRYESAGHPSDRHVGH